MAASSNSSKDQCLTAMVRLLDDAFGNHLIEPNKLVSAVRNSISSLKSQLVCQMAEEVAQLAVNGEPEEVVKEMLQRNFSSGVIIRNVEEMLKLVYLGSSTENLKKAINFVQIFDSCLQSQAYRALYEDVKFKKHTEKPEMLLLQNRLRLLVEPARGLDTTIKQVDDNCRKIISRIVRGIKQKDYSISIYIVNSIELAILDDNMATIVQEFYTGTLENTLQLIQYSTNLPHIQNKCFMVDALLKELEKRNLLDSIQAMHLWAHAKDAQDAFPNWPATEAIAKELCNSAIEIFSLNKKQLFRHYQKYVDDPDKKKIHNLHQSNWHLESIVREFVSNYHYGEVERAKNLLAVVEAIIGFYYPLILILSQLHEEMAIRHQGNSFEAFRIFNQVKRFIGVIQPRFIRTSTEFANLKEKTPACVRQLLWPEGTAEFQVVNKFFNATLSVQENYSVVCFDSSDKRSGQTWSIAVDDVTSLMTLTHAQNRLVLGTKSGTSSLCLAWAGTKWMVKTHDHEFFKIYCSTAGMYFCFFLVFLHDKYLNLISFNRRGDFLDRG
jgi:hypothetical protein